MKQIHKHISTVPQAEGEEKAERTAPFPFAFIIGAMKCGTTSLFNYLATHPEIAPCSTKEPDFFCRENLGEEDLDDYFSLWDWQDGTHKIALEASVNYTKIPANLDCAKQISRFSELDVRFIYCMRNPLERISSHAYHGLHAGWTQSLDEGISEHLINCSKYAMQLDAYTARFDRSRIHLVVLEEFKTAPEQGLKRIFEFLDVNPEFDVPAPTRRHNAAKDHYIVHPTWKRLRTMGVARAMARIVPPSVRRALRSGTGSKIDSRRTLTHDEKKIVLAELDSDLKRLRDVYGIDPAAAWGINLGPTS